MKERTFAKTRDWICPYCRIVAFNGENKLRHLSKHEPAIAKMLRKNLLLNLVVIKELDHGS